MAHDSYQKKITTQMTRLGGSFDWDKVAFTMDEVSDVWEMYLRVSNV